MLHTTRALDTALAEIVDAKGWKTQKTISLGGYIFALASNGVLTSFERVEYQRDLANQRNRYMHEAGAMPNQLEVNAILAKMHSCMVAVLSRI